MSLASLVSSLFSTVYADAPAEEPRELEAEEAEEAGESKEETEEASAPEEEEEDEPEDLHPVIREECKQTAQCAPSTKHFLHCQEKVQAGQGYKGEDCVEEFMMHCVDACAAPKLFAKLH